MKDADASDIGKDRIPWQALTAPKSAAALTGEGCLSFCDAIDVRQLRDLHAAWTRLSCGGAPPACDDFLCATRQVTAARLLLWNWLPWEHTFQLSYDSLEPAPGVAGATVGVTLEEALAGERYLVARRCLLATILTECPIYLQMEVSNASGAFLRHSLLLPLTDGSGNVVFAVGALCRNWSGDAMAIERVERDPLARARVLRYEIDEARPDEFEVDDAAADAPLAILTTI